MVGIEADSGGKPIMPRGSEPSAERQNSGTSPANSVSSMLTEEDMVKIREEAHEFASEKTGDTYDIHGNEYSGMYENQIAELAASKVKERVAREIKQFIMANSQMFQARKLDMLQDMVEGYDDLIERQVTNKDELSDLMSGAYHEGIFLIDEFLGRYLHSEGKSEPENDFIIRKVSILRGRAKEEADRLGLKDNDLVIVETIIKEGKLPEYKLEKIEGNPIDFLLNKCKKPEVKI